MTDSPVFDLTCQLIERASITPDDAGCQPLLADRLRPLGFNIEQIDFGEVTNLWAVHGTEGPLFVFLGHTDVVPTGPVESWQSDPFKPEVRDGLLYGRGTADMKASVAAMTVAFERFLQNHPNPKGRMAMLMTSDEEGPAVDGVVKVVEELSHRGEKIQWCLVGEPSSTNTLGDVIKNGRRGSLGAELTVKGIQGHIAYPHLARNPIHQLAPALAALAAEQWDEGNDFFPATSFQVSNINGGTGATNVIPGTVDVIFNFRFSTEVTAEQLQQRTEAILDQHGLDYDLTWKLSGQPFLTSEGALVEAVQAAIKDVTGNDTELSTSGGTSDGRFVAPTGAEVVELGPLNATIHKVDECVAVDALEPLAQMYEKVLEKLFS